MKAEFLTKFILSKRDQAARDLEQYSLMLQELKELLQNNNETEVENKFLKLIKTEVN